jgi:hypothetical protein
VSSPPAAPLVGVEKPTRREIVIAMLATTGRLFLGFWVIFFMLTLVPDAPDGRVLLPLLVAVLAVALYLWFFKRQLSSVYKARFPTLRAAEALVLVAGMFLALFAMIYVMISLSDSAAFTEELSPFNSYYFSLTVLATVGFGDITPVTNLARSVTMVQMALDLVFIAVLIRVIGHAARRALDERHEQASMPVAAAVVDD